MKQFSVDKSEPGSLHEIIEANKQEGCIPLTDDEIKSLEALKVGESCPSGMVIIKRIQ